MLPEIEQESTLYDANNNGEIIVKVEEQDVEQLEKQNVEQGKKQGKKTS